MRRWLFVLLLTGATAFLASCPLLPPQTTACGGLAGNCSEPESMP